jgi:hypothetical protein
VLNWWPTNRAEAEVEQARKLAAGRGKAERQKERTTVQEGWRRATAVGRAVSDSQNKPGDLAGVKQRQLEDLESVMAKLRMFRDALTKRQLLLALSCPAADRRAFFQQVLMSRLDNVAKRLITHA